MLRSVYAIIHRETGRRYVGASRDTDARWSQHRCTLRHGTHANKHLQTVWDADGPGAFDFVVLEAVDHAADLNAREQHWIDAEFQRGCFNIVPTAGSSLGYRHDDEAKAKLSAIHKGKTLSPEHRAIIAATHRRKPKPPEQRAKIAAGRRAYFARLREAA